MTDYLLNDDLFGLSLHNEKLTTAKYGKTFYFASFFMDKKIAERAYTLYTFCRLLDDIADSEVQQQNLSTLGKIQQKIVAIDGEKIPIDGNLSISKQGVTHLLDGFLSDQQKVRINTVDELLTYCYQVAGTVGVMMCDVMEISGQNALKHAIDLGIGMQLTNIARDVAEDARMDRRYLPQTWVGEVEPCNITMPSPALKQSLMSATEQLLDLAEAYYQSGLNGLKYLPRSCRFAIFQAATMYRAIGTDLKKHQMNNLTYRAHLTMVEKLTHLLGSSYHYLALLRRDNTPCLHQTQLHQAFSLTIDYGTF